MEEKFGECPVSQFPVFWMDQSKKKEWDAMPKNIKEHVTRHLNESCQKLTTDASIELICHVINDLHLRLRKVEGWSE